MNEYVLLVEDNDQDEKLTVRSLRKAGVVNPIEVVRDGQQALDYLFGTGEFARVGQPDVPIVMILDLGLPRVSGLDVLKRVRQHQATRLMPVVMLTSSDEEQDRLKSYQNGANAFVRKPVDFAEFAITVTRVGVFWALTNQPPPPA
ncbi:MAG: response regulator [Sterolibacteriaceae bacterium]|nr:response regulator [Sterolibacteriaceae bacterium]MBK9084080.1 response regulator [Sterolibacteriaceae bacterium]